MTELAHSLWWRESLHDRPPNPHWTEIGKHSFLEREERIVGSDRLPGLVPGWADELFRVARAAFIADKYVRRARVQDRWSRRIRLSVPVSQPERWHGTAAQDHLTALLQLLTGDKWHIEFRRLGHRFVQDALLEIPQPQASEVALFSGGLDSLSWAATRARADDAQPLLLVMFREIGLLRLQRRVYAAVRQLERTRDVLLLPLSQTPRGDGSKTRLETSSRTRGLLYATGAIRAATGHGVTTVHVPENGQLALNPALTAARSGALSTRSVHPWTLHHLNAVVQAIAGADNAVRIVNPWALLTKGEVCLAATATCLPVSALEDSLSCGKPPSRRRKGPHNANCGVCFPCLVRRSGLLRANGYDRTDYETEPWSAGLSPERTDDWRALQRWLLKRFSLIDLLTDRPLPPEADASAAYDVVRRGRKELAQLLRMAKEASAA
jgi:hypothetical protein